MHNIIIEHTAIDEIPTLIMAPAGAKNLPLVIFIHGFTGDKETSVSFGYWAVKHNLFFVAFDAPMHGERLHDRIKTCYQPRDDEVYPHDTGLDTYLLMKEVVQLAAADVDRLIDHFSGDDRVDASRVGLSGESMGAFATFYTAAHNPKIGAIAPVNGVPTFAARWDDVVLEASSYQNWAEAMEKAAPHAAEQLEHFKTIDPFDRLDGFAPKPLLMINGDQDTHAPKQYSVRLYRRLKPLYASAPDNLRLTIVDFVGHQFTRSMQQAAAGWFARHLAAD